MKTDILGRYYTDPCISSLLVQSLQINIASTVIDIGVGDGSLVKAAMSRYSNAQIVTADIEKKRKSIISTNPNRVRFHHIDGLKLGLSKHLKIKVGEVDVAVCNPPYRKLKMEDHHRRILSSAGFQVLSMKDRMTCDILFLAQNLCLLKNGGEIGIILPDTLLSGSHFMNFRIDILNTARVLGIIQLPIKVFSKRTEAATHILLLRKEKACTQYNVPIQLADIHGNVIDQIFVDSTTLATRMDYSFHKYSSENSHKMVTLRDLGATIFRGKNSKKELLNTIGSDNFFHLNNYREQEGNLDNLQFKNICTKTKHSKAGDILFARVGKRVLGKVAYVARGKIEISDCIYVIRLPKEHSKKVYRFLKTQEAQAYVQANSSGVCSRFITKDHLLNMPIQGL